MQKICIFALTLAMVAVSCQKEVAIGDNSVESTTVNATLSVARSYDEALAIAEDALKLLEGDDTRSAKQRSIKRDEGQIVYRPTTRGTEADAEPIMYVFNNENNEGFTVVAAARNQQPLIAVTEKGSYTYGEDTGVEAFDAYMNNMVSTLSIDYPTLPQPPTPDELEPAPLTHVEYINIEERVDPLLTTKWSQGGIYGKYCSNGKSGCVATAIGQIMAYHKHPEYLTMSYSDNSRVYFDWDKIVGHQKGASGQHCSCDTTCHIQIASLLREIGKRCKMKYYIGGGSSSNLQKAQEALTTMGYKNATFKSYSKEYSQFNNIKYNINDNKPVCLGGVTDNNGGHAWVADGYYHYEKGYIYFSENPLYDPNNPLGGVQYILEQDNVERIYLLHYNWGGSGVCDGWFRSSCYQMDQAYKDGEDFGYDDNTLNNKNNKNYKNYLTILYNIEPK